ncbi:MAG: winged helix-turn-helix transcriptional regulator [Acidimicrobiales bacterium]
MSRALDVLDGKWTILVVRDLLSGTKRFTELRRSLTGVSPKTLTDRLRSLERHGIVARRVYAEVPPRVEYSLTPAGRSLQPVMVALSRWGRTVASP